MTMKVRGALAIGAAILVAATCGVPGRTNAACVWTGDGVGALDLGRSADRTHLRHDADLREDLAIRYADASAGRAASPRWVAARDACMAMLLPLITAQHRVTVLDVSRATGQRNGLFDAAVFISFLLWCTVVTRVATRRILSASALRGPGAAVLAVAVTVVLGVACGGAGVFWSGFWEVVRIGNEHMSHRAWRSAWPYYIPSLFAAAAALAAAAAWGALRATAHMPVEPTIASIRPSSERS